LLWDIGEHCKINWKKGFDADLTGIQCGVYRNIFLEDVLVFFLTYEYLCDNIHMKKLLTIFIERTCYGCSFYTGTKGRDTKETD
jgi:hypothetical protein